MGAGKRWGKVSVSMDFIVIYKQTSFIKTPIASFSTQVDYIIYYMTTQPIYHPLNPDQSDQF